MGKKVKKPVVYILLLFVYLLGLSITAVCLTYAVKKRSAFYAVGDLKAQMAELVEILYIFLTIITIISGLTSICCSLTSNEPNVLGDGGVALVQFIIAIVWIVLPIAYTVLTSHELEGIPFSCRAPSIHNSALLDACRARRDNLIFMWINSGIMVLSTVTLCFCYYGIEIQDEEVIIENPSTINTISVSPDYSMETPPVLKRLSPYFCNN